MALDTVQERMAMMHFQVPCIPLLPDPDGAVVEEDRYSFLGLFLLLVSAGALKKTFVVEALTRAFIVPRTRRI